MEVEDEKSKISICYDFIIFLTACGNVSSASTEEAESAKFEEMSVLEALDGYWMNEEREYGNKFYFEDGMMTDKTPSGLELLEKYELSSKWDEEKKVTLQSKDDPTKEVFIKILDYQTMEMSWRKDHDKMTSFINKRGHFYLSHNRWFLRRDD